VITPSDPQVLQDVADSFAGYSRTNRRRRLRTELNLDEMYYECISQACRQILPDHFVNVGDTAYYFRQLLEGSVPWAHNVAE